MQPYFMPYIGYFQLINTVDKFIVYDNVEFTKKGWFNRNRLLFNNSVEYFTVNIKKGTDHLDVNQREIADVYFEKEMPKILRKIEQYYSDAPFFDRAYPVVKSIMEFKTTNLFDYIHSSIKQISYYLEINTEIIKSSSIPVDHSLKNKWRIFAICQHFNACTYINPIGGKELYAKEEFLEKKIELKFLSTNQIKYNQFEKEFSPNLSIIDVMMFNSQQSLNKLLYEFELE